MATTTFLAPSGLDYTDNASWSDNAPASGDTAVHDRGTGTLSVNVGNSAVDVQALLVYRGCGLNFGVAGTPFAITADQSATGVVRFAGSGSMHYFSAGGNTWNKAVLEPEQRAARFVFSDMTLTALEQMRGIVEAAASCDLSTLYIDGPAARIDIADTDAADTVGDTEIHNGAVVSTRRRIAGTCMVGPGSHLIYNVDTATTSGVVTLAGGRLTLQRGAVTVNGIGEIDASNLENEYTLTVTGGPGLVLREPPSGVTLTVSETALASGITRIKAA